MAKITILSHGAQNFEKRITILLFCFSVENFVAKITILSHSAENFER